MTNVSMSELDPSLLLGAYSTYIYIYINATLERVKIEKKRKDVDVKLHHRYVLY